MSLSQTTNFMTFNLHLPEGRWELSSRDASYPCLDSVAMSVVWEADGIRHRWDGDFPDAPLADSGVRDSIHGSMKWITVERMLFSDKLHLSMEFSLGLETPLFLWRIQMQNQSKQTISIDQVEMLCVGSSHTHLRRQWAFSNLSPSSSDKHVKAGTLRFQPTPNELAFYSTGWQSWTFAGTLGRGDRFPRTRFGRITEPIMVNQGTPVPRRRGSFASDMFGVVGDRRSRVGILAGFLSQREAFGSLETHLETQDPYLRLWANGDHKRLMPGKTFATDWACIQFVDLDAEVPFKAYLEAVASENNARRGKSIPVGWCTWCHFFQSVTQDDVLTNLQWAKQNRDAIPLEIIQIDDGFQEEVGDWYDIKATSFPDGMDKLSAKIRDAGFRAGLWLAPFVAKPGARLLSEHPEWILCDSSGRSVNAGFIFESFSRALDVTHPEYLAYLKDLIATVVHDWGYDYLKLDFLYAGALPGAHHDPTLTRAQAFYRVLKVIREAAGEDVTLLGCGCPLGSGVGIFDCMRIGPDVAPCWRPSYRGIKYPFKNEPGMPATRSAILSIISRGMLHRRWWIDDPDCLLVRDVNTHLTEAEVQSLATVISLSGGSLLVSDHLPDLNKERVAWLSRLLPPLSSAARIVDWFDATYPTRLVLPLAGGAGSWYLIALLNWNDLPADVNLDLEDMGVQYAGEFHTVDFWRASYDRIVGSLLRLSVIPAHGIRLLAVRPVLKPPQWLGDTLHVSQGLAVRSWQVADKRLVTQLDLCRHAQGRAWLSLPSAPEIAKLDNRSISWQQVSEGVYTFDLTLKGEARLEIIWE